MKVAAKSWIPRPYQIRRSAKTRVDGTPAHRGSDRGAGGQVTRTRSPPNLSDSTGECIGSNPQTLCQIGRWESSTSLVPDVGSMATVRLAVTQLTLMSDERHQHQHLNECSAGHFSIS